MENDKVNKTPRASETEKKRKDLSNGHRRHL